MHRWFIINNYCSQINIKDEQNNKIYLCIRRPLMIHCLKFRKIKWSAGSIKWAAGSIKWSAWDQESDQHGINKVISTGSIKGSAGVNKVDSKVKKVAGRVNKVIIRVNKVVFKKIQIDWVLMRKEKILQTSLRTSTEQSQLF